MKKLVNAIMLLLGLSIVSISCFGFDNKTNEGKTASNESYQGSSSTDLPENLCKSILTRLYNDYVFGNRFDQFDQVVDELFTKKAKQKLIDAYDYECDNVCFAIWELRTSAQDSKNDEENSHVSDIWNAVSNAYEVRYIDMGWKGATLFLFAMENGKVKIDDFVRWEDESAEAEGYGGSDMAKVVVDNQGLAGKYVFTDGSNYVVFMQDYGEVPISGHSIVTYSAENGQGVVYTYRSKVNVRALPSTNSAVITVMPSYEEGMCPETFPCLGKENGWYKIRINGKVGYVREDLADWCYMDLC